MKKIATLSLIAILGLTTISPASADWGHHRDFRPPMPFREQHHEHHERRGNWVGPAAVLAITGLALGAAAYSHAQPAPQPVYVAPQPVYTPPAPRGMWYYCNSSGQYYPYTNICPEGWVAVPAR